MPEAFALGPLLVPARPLAVLAALLLAAWCAGRLARRLRLDADWVVRVAGHAAWIGLIGARAGYVLLNWGAFAAAPWSAFHVWQPGYSPFFGIMLAAAYATWSINRRALPERAPALAALAGGYGIAAVLLIAGLAAAERWHDPGGLRVGDRVPDFRLQALDGTAVDFDSLTGRTVILNFWATWCAPCRREMPMLEDIHGEYAERGVSVIGIDLSEPREQVAAFARRTGVSYPIWLDAAGAAAADTTAALFSRFGGVGLPTTYFVDGDGIVRKIHVGELNRAIVIEQIGRLQER